MSGKPTLSVELTAAELELLTWRLCQPNYDEIGAYWTRHGINKSPSEASMDLYQRLVGEWQAWSLAAEQESAAAPGGRDSMMLYHADGTPYMNVFDYLGAMREPAPSALRR